MSPPPELSWGDAWKLLGMLALVLLNAFFVAAELALVKVRGTQLDALVAKGHRRARVARRLVDNLDAVIGATQLGITLASLGLGVVAEPVFHALLDPLFAALHIASPQVQKTVAILTGFFVETFLLIVAGELVPKALAIRKTLSVALWTAGPLGWFLRMAFPFIWVLNHAAQWVLRRCGFEITGETEHAHSAEELRLLIAASQQRAGATKLGREVVLNALDLPRRIARDVMRPRQEIAALDTEAGIADCLDVAERSRYSRFPLCEGGDVDRSVGVIHIKDLYAHRIKARRGADLLPAAKKIVFIPETARLDKLLQLFLDRRLHFALVVDEYGGTTGMVTLENVLEELVGPIQDEFDQEKPLLAPRGEGAWEVDGALPLHELSELVGELLYAEGVTTTSGWVTQQLGGFPKPGDVIALGRHELRVEEMNGPRVAKLLVTRIKEDAPSL